MRHPVRPAEAGPKARWSCHLRCPAARLLLISISRSSRGRLLRRTLTVIGPLRRLTAPTSRPVCNRRDAAHDQLECAQNADRCCSTGRSPASRDLTFYGAIDGSRSGSRCNRFVGRWGGRNTSRRGRDFAWTDRRIGIAC